MWHIIPAHLIPPHPPNNPPTPKALVNSMKHGTFCPQKTFVLSRVILISAFRETVPQAALSLASLHSASLITQNCFLLQGTWCYRHSSNYVLEEPDRTYWGNYIVWVVGLSSVTSIAMVKYVFNFKISNYSHSPGKKSNSVTVISFIFMIWLILFIVEIDLLFYFGLSFLGVGLRVLIALQNKLSWNVVISEVV